MDELTLVVMAAGLGSRFGGLKQITPVGPSGEFIIDYSIYDAIEAGFTKVVFIILESIYDEFRNTIGKRIENKIKVEYVFQKNSDIPKGFSIPASRTKPLGTGHALYTVRNNVTTPFAIISADDFYGDLAFKELADALRNTTDNYVVGYEIGKTTSGNGSVKRGVIFEENGYLKEIRESKVEKKGNIIEAESLNTGEKYTIEENNPVCMLLYGLRPEIFSFIDNDIKIFLNGENLEEKEYFLPDIIDRMMEKGTKVKILKTKSIWQGITYRDDLLNFQKYISEKIKEGKYPKNLWE